MNGLDMDSEEDYNKLQSMHDAIVDGKKDLIDCVEEGYCYEKGGIPLEFRWASEYAPEKKRQANYKIKEYKKG